MSLQMIGMILKTKKMNTSVSKLKFALSLICFVLIATASSSAQTMFYHTKDRKQISYDLLTVSNMTFTDDQFMVRNSNGITDAYPLSNFWKINFKLQTGLNPDLIFNSNTFRIYPNPAQELLNLSFCNEVKADATIRILNLNGDVLITQPILSSGDVQIKASQLPTGIYLCQFKNGESISFQKIIKQ